jgi:hypothetical protein
MPQRRFHRVTFSMPAELTHQGLSYRGRVENISLRGALISSRDCLVIPLGEQCRLSLEDGEDRIVVTAQVVHSFFSMAGVQFVAFEEGAELRLFRLMQRITEEPETLRVEWEMLLGHGQED